MTVNLSNIKNYILQTLIFSQYHYICGIVKIVIYGRN